MEILQSNPEETIRILQEELAETNGEVLLLTLELEKRVEERTADLRIAEEELRKRNAELIKRTAQLEAVNKELETFSYSVSHDLRAPARRISSFLSLMIAKHGTGLDSEAREYLDRVSTSAKEMTALIDSLLAFSQMGRVEMREARFDLNELISEVIEEMSEDFRDRNIDWNIHPMPTVRGDPALLKQVWVNLTSNAVKYTRPRNPARIEMGWSEKDSAQEFYVKDNGVGFDMEHAQKLFGAFQRMHSANEFEGSGIGLANVQQIVGRHGGRVRAESRPGEGAVFYFTLPV
jgi:light-regulated signal transduction histidine kinase (bacteriophytochrome)